MLPEQVLDLTPFQLKRILWRPPELDQRGPPESPRMKYLKALRDKGLDAEEVGRLMKEFDAAFPQRAGPFRRDGDTKPRGR